MRRINMRDVIILKIIKQMKRFELYDVRLWQGFLTRGTLPQELWEKVKGSEKFIAYLYNFWHETYWDF